MTIPRPLPIPEDAPWRPGPPGLEEADFRDSNGVSWHGVRRVGEVEPDRLFAGAEWETFAADRPGAIVPVGLSNPGFNRLCRTWRDGRAARRSVDRGLLTDSVRAVGLELLARWDYDSVAVLNTLLYDDAATGNAVSYAMAADRLRRHAQAGHEYLTPLNAAGVMARFTSIRDLTIGTYKAADRKKSTTRLELPSVAGTTFHRNTPLRRMTSAQLVDLTPDETLDPDAFRQAVNRVLAAEPSDPRRQAVAMFYAPLLNPAQSEPTELPARANYPAYERVADSVGLRPSTVSLVLRDARAALVRNYRALRRPGV